MCKRSGSLIVALVFFIASCQPQPALRTASPPPLPTTALPAASASPAPLPATPLPAASPTHAPTFTSTAEASPTPAPTDTPQPAPASAAACFVASGFPFAFMPDNIHILYKGDTGIQIVDLQTKTSEAFLPSPEPTGLLGAIIALSPNGDRLALALTNNSIQVYQTADKKLLHTLSGHNDLITKLKYSPDGKKLYSASHDTFVRVWDQAGNLVDTFQPTGGGNMPQQVMGIGISPDGKLLATMPGDGKVKIWDAEKFTLVRELGANGGYEYSDVIFSPDGQYLAATTVNGLFLWKVSDGTQLMGGNPGINAMALTYSPDGSLVYWDIEKPNEITFLSPDGSQKIRTLPTDLMPIMPMFFSPDNQFFVAASNTESRVWRVTDGKLFAVGKPECP